MYKKWRPEPLSPFPISDKIQTTHLGKQFHSKSTRKTLNADLFISSTGNQEIKNMKIFNEENDEGMPKHWDDKLKPFQQNPSIYDSLHSATLRPELHPPRESWEFKRGLHQRLLSANPRSFRDMNNLDNSNKDCKKI